MNIFVIGCGKAKKAHAAAAAELYTGSLFTLAKKAALRLSKGRYYILSAKHGLLRPSDIIAPYDVKMKAKTTAEFTAILKKQIECLGLVGATFICLAGTNYANALRAAGVMVQEPLSGKSMGLRMQILNRQLS